MGREVRRVPEDWKHPVDESGVYIPLCDRKILEYQDLNDPEEDKIQESELMPDFGESATHWQMYEDTTEGTPISPVFDNPEDLATWLYENKASAFGSSTASREHWLQMIYRGWAPSMVLDANGIRSGVEDVGSR
jgi:hypothetical protein